MPRENSDGTFAFVYIMSSSFRRLYIGVTTTLAARVNYHKAKVQPDSFTARYLIDRLVYFECFADISNAIAREKELKGWLRVRKIALIVAANPTWKDLSEGWESPSTLSARKICILRESSGSDLGYSWVAGRNAGILRFAQDDNTQSVPGPKRGPGPSSKPSS